MIRGATLTSAVLLATVLSPRSVFAQDMDFSLDEIEGEPPAETNGDQPDLSFDVIDTRAAANEAVEAERSEADLIRVIQRRPFLRRQRVEFSPFLGTNLNDPLVKLFVAGGHLNFHLTEVMAIGISGGYSLGSETDLFDEVIQDYELFPELSKVQWFGGLNFQYAPVYGKFALFNTWIVPWDTYVLLGAGYTKTELDGHPTLSVGIGQRYFMSRWFTVNVELRDMIYNENYPSGSELVNNLVFTAGVGFFLPPDFEYTTPK